MAVILDWLPVIAGGIIAAFVSAAIVASVQYIATFGFPRWRK